MADYGYGSEVGNMYHQALSGVGRDVGRAMQQYHKDHENAQAAQAILDIAKRFQLPDAKTGKPKNVFQDDHIQYVQDLVNQKKYKAAGAAEAMYGMTQGAMQRLQTASAKQQDLATQQQRSLGGPYKMTSGGVNYVGNFGPDGIVHWAADKGIPRNEMGLSAKDQFYMQKAQVKDTNQAQQAQFKSDQQAKIAQNHQFNALLKGVGINSPVDLFDPSIQRAGTVDTTGNFVNDPNQDPTHLQFYHQDPPTDDKGKPIPKANGKMGITLPLSDVTSFQNAAAATAGPQAVQALQWLRQNPTSEHADAVRQEIIARTSEATKAPDPATFQPTAPSFAPPSAPAQPYAQQPQQQDDLSGAVADQ